MAAQKVRPTMLQMIDLPMVESLAGMSDQQSYWVLVDCRDPQTSKAPDNKRLKPSGGSGKFCKLAEKGDQLFEQIEILHLSEAIQYRGQDRKLG